MPPLTSGPVTHMAGRSPQEAWLTHSIRAWQARYRPVPRSLLPYLCCRPGFIHQLEARGLNERGCSRLGVLRRDPKRLARATIRVLATLWIARTVEARGVLYRYASHRIRWTETGRIRLGCGEVWVKATSANKTSNREDSWYIFRVMN